MEVCESKSFHELGQYVLDEIQKGFETFDDSQQRAGLKLRIKCFYKPLRPLPLDVRDVYCSQSSSLKEALTE